MTRPEQLPEYLRAVVGRFLAEELELPKGVFVTVTRVELTRGKERATVRISVLPHERAEEIIALLRERHYDLQGTVNKTVTTRPVPRVSFRLDRGPATSDRIDRLLRTIHD